MKHWRLIIPVILFFMVLPIAYTQSSNPQPGSPEDPLITKGYVDEQMTKQITTRTEQIRADLNQMIATNVTQAVQQQLEQQTKALVQAELEKQVPEQVTRAFNEKANYQLVVVPSGQTILFGEGTEVVVRSGRVTVFSPDANGISDLSDGKDLAPKTLVSKNHLLLFPRNGRGLSVASGLTTGSAMIVRGSYTLSTEAAALTATPAPTANSNATKAPAPTTSATATTVLPSPTTSSKSGDLLQ